MSYFSKVQSLSLEVFWHISCLARCANFKEKLQWKNYKRDWNLLYINLYERKLEKQETL